MRSAKQRLPSYVIQRSPKGPRGWLATHGIALESPRCVSAQRGKSRQLTGCCRNRAAANRHESIFLTSKAGRYPSRQPLIPHLQKSRRNEFAGTMLGLFVGSAHQIKAQMVKVQPVASFSLPPTAAAATLSARCTWAVWEAGWENQRDWHRLHVLAPTVNVKSHLSGRSTWLAKRNATRGDLKFERSGELAANTENHRPVESGNAIVSLDRLRARCICSQAVRARCRNEISNLTSTTDADVVPPRSHRRAVGNSELQSCHPAQPPHAPPMGQGFIPPPWALGELGLVDGHWRGCRATE